MEAEKFIRIDSSASGGQRRDACRSSSAAHPVSKEAAELWLAQSRKAIDAYNADIEANGVWSDGVRCW
ncbi:type II toxin-antitoxin system CcdA family antitoxin [Aestuariivirga sp.]|uniref:type II toxin-antitoxin system CcdA family antitoxin n=1 Tax=Aestuariivirga sp. TaxID=2650926 RepID=UPI0039E720A3